MFIVATENNVLMKIPISLEVKSNANTYLLQNNLHAIENIELSTGDSSMQIVLLTVIDKNSIWILFSDGKLYEYNFCNNQFGIIEHSEQIDYLITL